MCHTLSHTEAFTRRHFYTQTLLHADAFTHTRQEWIIIVIRQELSPVTCKTSLDHLDVFAGTHPWPMDASLSDA